MIPVVIDPSFEQTLDVRKVHHATKIVHFIASDMKFDQIIMAMQVRTLAFVVEQSVAGAKRDFSHNGNAHDGLGFLEKKIYDGKLKLQLKMRTLKFSSLTKLGNTSSTRKPVHPNTQKNALACTSSLH